MSGAGLEGLRGEKLTSGMGHMTNPVLGAGWASGKRLTENAYSMRPRYFMNHAVAKKKVTSKEYETVAYMPCSSQVSRPTATPMMCYYPNLKEHTNRQDDSADVAVT